MVSWVGELLAVNEFNNEHSFGRSIPEIMRSGRRIFKGAYWIDQIFIVHALDHAWRNVENKDMPIQVVEILIWTSNLRLAHARGMRTAPDNWPPNFRSSH
jgi:hypothetical protein